MLRAALGPTVLAAHTIVKQIVDFAMAIFGTFSTVAQSLIATCLGKARPCLTRCPQKSRWSYQEICIHWVSAALLMHCWCPDGMDISEPLQTCCRSS